MSRIEIASYVPHNQGKPKLNAPSIVGGSPGKPFLYVIPMTGQRPITLSVTGILPDGLTFDTEKGRLEGVLTLGEYPMTIRAENALGAHEKRLTLRIAPDGLGRTPLMGWCSWNAFGAHVTQQKVENAAQLMVNTGLSSFGYQYVNTDSSWQGEYGGNFDAIQSNNKFPDMKAMTDHIHALGLKAGIYSTPMQKAWGGGELAGCTRGKMDNRWPNVYYGIGMEHREQACVDQWTEWGFDYLKYDWEPCDPINAELMKDCLRRSARDFMFCVTVSAGITHADYWKSNCNSWRDNPDSMDRWENVLRSKFQSDIWAVHINPGHFFDMDMLETGWICEHLSGEGRASRLTEDEQIATYTMRALFPSPLQVSCDLERLSEFDMALLCNEEVIAVNQDALGIGTVCVYKEKTCDMHRSPVTHKRIYARALEDGAMAVGLFNLSEKDDTVSLPLNGTHHARDLWAKRNLGVVRDELALDIPPHAVRLIKLSRA